MSTPASSVRSAAAFISVILHPLMMPMYATFILFNSGSYIGMATTNVLQRFIYIVVFISTYLLPAITAYVMWKSGWIKNLEMSDRKDRTIPFIATLFCYAAGAYLLFSLPVPRIFGVMVSGAALAILWCLLVNLKWKISIHMVGIGGVMGILFGFAYYFHADVMLALIVLSVLAGILGTARLLRNAHLPSQVYLGFLGGFFLEFYFFRMIAISMAHV